MYPYLIVLHVLGASVWVSGHLVLALGVLPGALRRKDVAAIATYEDHFERVGIPALLLQVITGYWMASTLLAGSAWVDMTNPLARAVIAKSLFLAITAGLALDARFRLIPKLSEENLTSLAWHIVAVTLTGVLFLVVGVGVRFGMFV